MLSPGFILQLASSGLTGALGIFTISYISKNYGVDGFGLYSTLLIAVSLSNALESAQQQVMLRSYAGDIKPPTVYAYLRSNTLVIWSVAFVCASYFLVGYMTSLGGGGAKYALAESFKQLRAVDIAYAGLGTFFLSLVPLMSYALIASSHLMAEAVNNMLGVTVRSMAVLGVLFFSGYDFPSACAMALMVSGVMEIMVRVPVLLFIQRSERSEQAGGRRSMMSCIKSSRGDFILLLLSASLVPNDRLVAAMQFDKSSFGVFAFVYAVVLASAIVPNSYMRSILKPYWGGDGAELLRPTALRLIALSGAMSMVAYVIASSYLAYNTGAFVLDVALNGAAISGYVLATSAMLAGCVQFLCFKYKVYIWHNFLKARLGLLLMSAFVLYMTGGTPVITFLLVMLHVVLLLGLLRSLLKA